MPVRSLRSVVLKWPDRTAVIQAARSWAEQLGASAGEIRRIGAFGSYATGKWGVGSDLDILILVDVAEAAFAGRALRYPVSSLPVPCQVLVYTLEEWRQMLHDKRRFALTVEAEAVWLFRR